MADGLDINTMENYRDVIIPKLESELSDSSKSPEELLELYNLYIDVLRLIAPMDFPSFNKYLELDEDHNVRGKAFFFHRKDALAELFQAFNDMEIYDKYDMLLVSCPPRVGKTTTGIRFLAWIGGRYPEFTQMATSYSGAITKSFYSGIMEIVTGERFLEIFPDEPLVNQNAQQQEIWLKVQKRYPTLMFISIDGSMTGRGDAKQYIYCDDLVSGYEEAISPTRLEKLWNLYTVNVKQRKSDKCKEIHIATMWSVHDPITKLARDNEDNPRCKIIKLPWDDGTGHSRFDYFDGFSTEYYLELKGIMDTASFGALYECEPVEREGLLYHEEDLRYYFELPTDRPDAIIGVCDSKNLGVDYVSAPIAYVYGDTCYIDDVVFNNGLPEITRPLVSEKMIQHKVTRLDVEVNNGGNYYAEDLHELIKAGGGSTSVRTFPTTNNKNVKIITFADYVVKNFVFKHKSTYSPNSEYAKFMKQILSWTQTGKNKHDDAPDSVAMLAQLHQELSGFGIKIINRRAVGV